jgi:tetratricopeptide (TPR) repeat protein
MKRCGRCGPCGTIALLALCLPAAAGASSFDEAMKAVAAKNDAAALPLFEAALTADADNLQVSNEYRKAVMRTGEYDRAIDFYDKLTEAHPQAAYAWLNYGYVYVDKIPAAGSITQVILANNSITNFTKSIELKRSWIALYTRGNAYLYWPKIFGRAPLGVADLEEAVAIAKKEPKRRKVYVRAWIGLGDGYWKTGEPEKAKAIWREGVQLFGNDPQLQARLARDGEELEKYIYDQLDPNKRVDTNMAPLWEGE